MNFVKKKTNALKTAFALIVLLLTSGNQYSQSSVLSSGGDFKSSKASFIAINSD